MKRTYRNAVAVAAALVLCLAAAAAAGPQIYKNNVRTAQHVVVAGTHVAIVPPGAAKKASRFAGFEIPDRRVSIVITELMQEFEAYAASGLTPSALEGEGIAVADTSKVTLNGGPGLLVTGTTTTPQGVEGGGEEFGVVLLAFGSERVTAVMHAYYPATDRSAATLLRNALLTAIFDSGPVAKKGGGYTIETGGTEFSFVDEASSVRYYTVKGGSVKGEVETALYTSAAVARSVAPTERKAFADESFKRFMSAYEHTVSNRKEVSFGGLPGIELVADFEGAVRRDRTASGGTVRRKMPGKGYQVVLFDDAGGKVYLFSGIAVRDAEKYLSQFKRMTSSFRRIP